MSFIADYTGYIKEHCDAPHIFHEFMARAVIGIAARNKVYYQYGGNKVFPNFWMAYFAKSSAFRKSTSMKSGLDILNNIFTHDDDAGRPIPGALSLPLGFSPESLYPILAEKPYGYMFYSEFDEFLEILDKEYMKGGQALLTDLYDVPSIPRLRTLITKSTVTIQPNTTVSILGATTPSGFMHIINESKIKRGFIPRWIIIYADKKENTFPTRDPDRVVLNKLEIELRAIVSTIEMESKKSGNETPEPIRITFDIDTRRKFDNWVIDFEKKIDDKMVLAPALYRMPANTIKIAMAEAVNDFSFEIKNDHFDKALALTEMAVKSLKLFEERELALTDYQKDVNKVLEIIRSYDGGIARSILLRKARMHKNTIEPMLHQLTESKDIVMKEKKSKDAKKQTAYYVINENRLIL